MKNFDDHFNKISLATTLEDINGYLPFDISNEKKAELATEIYKAQVIAVSLREVAEAIRSKTSYWNNSDLTDLVIEVLRGIHSSGIKIKKDI